MRGDHFMKASAVVDFGAEKQTAALSSYKAAMLDWSQLIHWLQPSSTKTLP